MEKGHPYLLECFPGPQLFVLPFVADGTEVDPGEDILLEDGAPFVFAEVGEFGQSAFFPEIMLLGGDGQPVGLEVGFRLVKGVVKVVFQFLMLVHSR